MLQYFARIARRHPGPYGGVNRSKFNFLEHGHDAYQLKGNH